MSRVAVAQVIIPNVPARNALHFKTFGSRQTWQNGNSDIIKGLSSGTMTKEVAQAKQDQLRLRCFNVVKVHRGFGRADAKRIIARTKYEIELKEFKEWVEGFSNAKTLS